LCRVTRRSAGSVVTARGGEELTLYQTAGWIPVDISQNLLAGDVLRTNANGTLAILFADQTQIRVGRNSTMVVKEMQPRGPGPAGAFRGQYVVARQPGRVEPGRRDPIRCRNDPAARIGRSQWTRPRHDPIWSYWKG
jgi:hypothetical protein